jgi:hypothetical protein
MLDCGHGGGVIRSARLGIPGFGMGAWPVPIGWECEQYGAIHLRSIDGI